MAGSACLRAGEIPDADLVDAISVCKIKCIDVAIQRVHALRQVTMHRAMDSNQEMSGMIDHTSSTCERHSLTATSMRSTLQTVMRSTEGQRKASVTEGVNFTLAAPRLVIGGWELRSYALHGFRAG